MGFARFVLALQALVMACLSLAYWLRPYEMANLNGMLLMESASISHMRVYYGGLQLGLALFLLWAMAAAERARAALVLVAITMLVLIAARLGSWWLDGGELMGFDLLSLLYRLLAVALAAAALLSLRPPGKPAAPVTRPPTLSDEPPKPFQRGAAPEREQAAEQAPALRRGDGQPPK